MNTKIQNEKIAKEVSSRASARNNYSGTINHKAQNQTPCFSGVSSHCFNQIDLRYNPEYPLHDVAYSAPFLKAIGALVEHEIVHKYDIHGRGCPKDEKLDIKNILTPMSRVLAQQGLPNIPYGGQGHTLYSFFANLYEDYVVNSIGSDNIGSTGFFLLYDDMAQQSKGFGELFEAFVKLQAMTFPSSGGLSSVVKHFKGSEKAKQAYKNFLERTGLSKMQKKDRVGYLANPENWTQTSEIFAEEFCKLVDLNNPQASYFQLPFGNDFKRLNDEDVQMAIALEAYNKSDSEFSPPEFMEQNLALLSLYRKLAKGIEMKVNSNSAETTRPVSYVSRRAFDFGKDSLERISFGIDESGRIAPQIGRYPLDVKSRYQVSAGTFPEVRVGLLDCSDSTRSSIGGVQGKVMNPWAPKEKQWTDTSIYHHELLSFFGLCELFRRHGTLRGSNTRLGVFSDSTRMAKDLGASERIALQPAFGNTNIEKDAVDEIFEGEGSIVYTISDGEVGNWDSLKQEFIKGAKKHHYFHLQVGKKTDMYDDLKNAGLIAKLDNGANSSKILIDLTQQEIFGAK